MLPSLDGNPRSVDEARDVVSVFRLYEKRLREHSPIPGRPDMSNSQRDLVRRIVSAAVKALNSLKQGSNNSLLSLQRAYENGANVEQILDELVNCFERDSRHLGASSTSIEHQSKAPFVPMMPSTTETYCAGRFVPSLPANVYLEFYSRDETGNFCAPEGNLKATLMSSTAANHIIAARGAESPEPVHGASDMTGVGKTIALIALGHDRDVRDHFRDGVLYMALGADASVEHITRSLSKIMKFTGARASADAVRKETNLTAAVEDAALWFQGKRNLFLIDDVWPTAGYDTGYLSQLQNILEGCCDSRIVITTRNRRVGSSVLSHVEFDARDPLGPTSTSIFMGYATNGCKEDVGERAQLASVQGILRLCAGLPIALSVTGGFVAASVCSGLDFQYACDSYSKSLEARTNFGASILESAIKMSLEYLDSTLLKSLASPPSALDV